jgi:hypothetical protein
MPLKEEVQQSGILSNTVLWKIISYFMQNKKEKEKKKEKKKGYEKEWQRIDGIKNKAAIKAFFFFFF